MKEITESTIKFNAKCDIINLTIINLHVKHFNNRTKYVKVVSETHVVGHHEKTCFLYMRKQRQRSAMQSVCC